MGYLNGNAMTREQFEAARKSYLEGADAKAKALEEKLIAEGYAVEHERYPSSLDGTYRFEVRF